VISVVRFTSGGTNYAVRVEQILEVRPATGITPLPAAASDVAGLLTRGDQALTVYATLGPGREHVLVLDGGDGAVALLVDEVTGVAEFDADVIGPPPVGHAAGFVTGVAHTPDGLVLFVDATALVGGAVR